MASRDAEEAKTRLLEKPGGPKAEEPHERKTTSLQGYKSTRLQVYKSTSLQVYKTTRRRITSDRARLGSHAQKKPKREQRQN